MRIQFQFYGISSDEDLLDSVKPVPNLTLDVLIPLDKVQTAAELLQSSTAFLRDIDVLKEKIPVIRKSVNNLVAGANRTVADLFDLTGEFESPPKPVLVRLFALSTFCPTVSLLFCLKIAQRLGQ